MAGTTSSRVSKAPKRTKGGTVSTKNHRFESFTQRIAKLNIDPISKARQHDLDRDDLDTTTSHFETGLSKWRELNLSEEFSNFVQEVEPLCESLPQILYKQDEIMDILVKYLEKSDALSLEPLLSLLSQFAHDLGTRFERHFARALSIVTSIAAVHPNVEVIEWSFTSLAWLFKYLSRLLVPDLRPTFNIMSPLLGKAQHKPHIARFAAEAMSFLIRKAALGAHKNREPLSLIVGHSIADFHGLEASGKPSDIYKYGLMNLYADAIKGINNELHSSATTIFDVLLESEIENESSDIVTGVFVNSLHHTTASTFAPLLDTVMGKIDGLPASAKPPVIHLLDELCFLAAAVRKGSRVHNWKSLIDSVCSLQQVHAASGHHESEISPLAKAAAAAFQYAPLDAVIPRVRGFTESLSTHSPNNSFLSFCIFFSDLGAERFETLIAPYFYKTIVSSWQSCEERTVQAVLQTTRYTGTRSRTLPADWSNHILSILTNELPAAESLSLLNGYLDVLDLIPISKECEAGLASALGRGVVSATSSQSSLSDELVQLALGRKLRSLLECSTSQSELETLGWTCLLNVQPRYFRMPLYITNLTQFCDRVGVPSGGMDGLMKTLCSNLMSSSKELREASLKLLSIVHHKNHGSDDLALQTALTIEALPLNLQSVRVISMHIRKMPGMFDRNEVASWSQKMIVQYLFGLLTLQLSPVWADTVEALGRICETPAGEAMVSEIAFSWLAHVGMKDGETDASSQVQQNSNNHRVNEFECTNVQALNIMYFECAAGILDAKDHLARRLETSQKLQPLLGPNTRVQALRVLNGIPRMAEKRSRQLVPYLFSWMRQDQLDDNNVDDPEGEISADPPQATADYSTGSTQERKALLGIFGAFTNPRVLYQSEEVFATLLHALTNGDVEVQKLALKALFTWKLTGVKPYQENLLNITDDARFREELSVFLQTENESGMRLEHKSDLMPILLRLLYGKVTARAGSSSNRASQGTRRRAVFDSLAKFADDDIATFARIALGPLHGSETVQVVLSSSTVPQVELMTPRKQLGILNMIKDMLDVFGQRLTFLIPTLAPCVLYSICFAASRVQQAAEENSDQVSSLSLYRDIRQTGIVCVNQMYARCSPQELRRYTPSVLNIVILPRLEKLPIETAQGVSGVLRLFSTWASNAENAAYLLGTESILPKVADILNVPSAKDEVKIFAINDVLKQLIRQCQSSDVPNEGLELSESALRPFADHILWCAGDLLEKSPSKVLLTATIELVSMMSSIVSGSSQVQKLLSVTSFLIDQPTARVHARAKGELLHIIERLTPLSSMVKDDELFDKLYISISALFKYFRDRDNRTRLCAALEALSQIDAELTEVAITCRDLNSYSHKSIDEPDFDRRLQAFTRVNEIKHRDLSERQWRPILFNFLYYLRDEEELAVRSSASYGLRQFVEASTLSSDDMDTGAPKWDLIRQVLLPSLLEGSAEKSELVRSEFMTTMAHIIRKYPNWNEVTDMVPLLMQDDEEASFFSNILHLQQHRRLRALRRLAEEASKQGIKSINIAHFFMPLIEHFVFDKADDSGAHNLASETITTIGALAHGLEWPQIRAVFRRYAGYIASKPELEKAIVRLIGVLIDAIQHASSVKHNGSHSADDETLDATSTAARNPLSLTIPRQEKLSHDVVKNILPSLLSYLHNKDESTVSLRVPVAVSAVKLLKVLPESDLMERLPPLLTDVSHILRSRAQESRDMTRKTLVDISAIIGPGYFGFVLKELRASLARGYQLHVLSYTVHSILVETAPLFKPGQLDYCLPQVVAIIMDDIFGATGQEKDAEDYISKMKEVKSSKSYDSMELIAKTASIERLSSLIKPIQSLLDEKLDLRTVKKIDELLRRIGLGLLRNEAVECQATLVFCYEMIQHAYKRSQQPRAEKIDPRTKRFLVNTRGAKFGPTTRSTSSFGHKLTRFAFDLLRMVLHKHESLKTPANLSGFMPAIGDAVLGAHEEVQMSTLRLIAEIIKVDMQELDRNASVFVLEAVKLIKNAVSTNTEISQAALKLITAVLRERKKATVKEIDIAYLLQKSRPDLDEPDRQGVTFNFLKAVLSRRIVITEVYETMDAVASMMITNQSRTTRVMARGVYFDFLMNYPQGKDRLSKQIKFLLKNLDYKHVEGRQSVMEAIHHLISKSPRELIDKFSTTFFVPLVLATVNDDSPDCRRMAGALIKTLFEKCDDEQSKDMVKMLRTWIASSEQPLLVRASLQLYGTLVDIESEHSEEPESTSEPKRTTRVRRDLDMLKVRIVQLLKGSLKNESSDWELLYYTLQLASKLTVAFPEDLLAADQATLWVTVRQCSFFHHAWVKFAAANLLGYYFTDFARMNSDLEALSRPLKGSHGLRLNDEEMITMMKAFSRSLRIPGIGQELATQLARNLVFLGQYLPIDPRKSPDEDESSASEQGSDVEDVEKASTKPPLKVMFERLSGILRHEPINNKAPALIPKMTAIRIIASLSKKLSPLALEPCLQTVLLPLLTFTDSSFSAPFSTDEEFTASYASIVSSSHEILGALQKNLGTTRYVKEVATVQSAIKARREERRVKRRLEAVTEPERIAEQKKRKIERGKMRRKEKTAEFRGRRRGW